MSRQKYREETGCLVLYIADWIKLTSVKFHEAVIHGGCTEIHLDREYSSEFTSSSCGEMLFWSWDCRAARIRDLPIFEFKPYLVIEKHRTNCPSCGVKIEKLEFIDLYSRYTTRFEELVARPCCITSLKQVAKLLDMDWKTVKSNENISLRSGPFGVRITRVK